MFFCILWFNVDDFNLYILFNVLITKFIIKSFQKEFLEIALNKEVINVAYHFTYKNYITCIHNIKQKDYLDLKEESEKYTILLGNNIETQYKCIIEYLFKDQERICKLINCISNCQEKIKKENLKCIEFVRKKKGIKIVYKYSNKHIFYVIIYQQEISLHLPYYILQDCIKIIQNYKEENMKDIIIIPFVIYVKENIYCHDVAKKHYFEMTTYDDNILELKYNLIHLLKILNISRLRNTILEELIWIEGIKQSI